MVAFPIMLDFMYSQDDELKATTETAAALRWMSNYFEIEALFHAVNTLSRVI